MMKFLVLALTSALAAAASDVNFDFVAREYIPAGFKEGTTTGVPDLFGFGFGGLERSYYDSKTKLFYGGSEIGFVTISDFSAYPTVTVTDVGFPLTDSLTDIKICGDLLFVTTKNDPGNGKLLVFSAASILDTGGYVAPVLLQSLTVGAGPDNILVTGDCMTAVTANEGEGVYDDSTGLTNPVGSVSILTGPFGADSVPGNTLVSLNKWTESELLEKGVHLPLSLNAMIYWQAFLGSAIDLTDAISMYTPDAGLEPEYLAFNGDESKIYVNLQENNAVIVIDVSTATATDIFAYGLKTNFPVDIVEDGGCDNMPIVDGLHFLRIADSIATFEQDGMTYLVTANEGDDVEYGDFEEKVKSKDIFKGVAGAISIGFTNMTADAAVLDQAKYFASNCDDSDLATTPFCAKSMRFSVGSSMVDYSDPEAPNIYRLTALGGRGITIYKVTDTGLDMVWDSYDDLERAGCAAFPWAHNAIQDEEFAPVGGALYNSLPLDSSLRETIEELNFPDVDGCMDQGDGSSGACPMGQTVDERALKDGYAAETVVVGTACGKTYAVTVSEKNSVGFLYDVSNAADPTLAKVFHLSPVSETLSPGLAYEARTLGEIDSETIQFLSESKSPTGKAAVLFSGAFSGTVSLWEFTCPIDASNAASTDAPNAASTDAPNVAPTDAPNVAPTDATAAPTPASAGNQVVLSILAVSLALAALVL